MIENLKLAKYFVEVKSKNSCEIPNFKSCEMEKEPLYKNEEKEFSPLKNGIPTFQHNNQSNVEIRTSNPYEREESSDYIKEHINDFSDPRKEQSEEMCNAVPRNDGRWSGESGDSTWNPDPDVIPQRDNPNGKKWEDILSDNNIDDGVKFENGEPDFSTISESTVEIDDFSSNRSDNYDQAEQKTSEQWTAEQKDGKNWTKEDVEQYRRDNSLTWHERSDMKTMDLVPREVHGNISHSGGISASKNNNT